MRLIDDLLESVRGRDAPVRRVCVELHWMVVESRHAGVAHTFRSVNDRNLAAIAGKRVAVSGRFPFNDLLAEKSGKAFFFEMEPEGEELPPFAAEEVLPDVDVAVISATALINKSLPRLLELAKGALSVVLGPSTPMNRVLLGHGARLLGGIRVRDPDALFSCLAEGVKKFSRIAGIEPVILERPSR